MKRILTFIFTGVLMSALCAGFAACDKPEHTPKLGAEMEYTQLEVNISERWRNPFPGEVIVINSQEELRRHYNYIGNDSLNIDFSKHTLLLTKDYTSTEVHAVNVESLLKFPENKYELDIKAIIGDATYTDVWQIALITDKLSEDSDVELSVKQEQGTEAGEQVEYDLLDISIPQEYIPWPWEGNLFLVIDSYEELKKHVKGDYPEIDFSEKTLLIVGCRTGVGISKAFIKSLLKLSTNEYRLNIKVILTDATTLGVWQFALVTDKLSKDSDIGLSVK